MNQAEADRIRRVFAEYEADPNVQRRWDPANPGNAANRSALQRQIAALVPDLHKQHILEIGCGHGDVLALLAGLGAEESRCTGVDLRENALCHAQSRFPRATFKHLNAETLPFADSSFDIVALFTVLSSVLAPDSRRAIAAEAARVLRPGGVVLWYDLRRPNPWNRHIQPITRRGLSSLFPRFELDLTPATLIPQIARRLGAMTTRLFPMLHAIPALRSHWLGLLRNRATN
jgi:ubiquinone/menaquinone biosynthesis C-methylase UbiE